MKKNIIFIIFITLILNTLFSEQRYALIIGNSDYNELGALKNPVNDATDMAQALETIGFQVSLIKNANLIEMEDSVTAFKKNLSRSSDNIGFFYYAGHGVQSNGENFLIPSHARISSESYLKSRSFSVNILMDELKYAGNSLNIIVLDACRDNPFNWNRSGSRGLVVVGSRPAGSIVVYATSEGAVASDGTGRNGLFTGELLKHLTKPNIDISKVFRLTGAGVQNKSNGKQVPAIYNQFFDEKNLVQKEVASLIIPTDKEKRYDEHNKPEQSITSSSGIDLILVESGSFKMGSNEGDTDQQPSHNVRITKDYYIGKYEVTQKEWRTVMGNNPSFFKGDSKPVEKISWYDAIEYCNKLSEKEGLTPVYSGSGRDVKFNSNASGYRLPTEAEWEFAARGGENSKGYKYSGSNSVKKVAVYIKNSMKDFGTKNVGTKLPNELGLYDMSGNVQEWCWDWKESYSSSSQIDPRGNFSGSDRIVRGGSWGGNAEESLTIYRYGYYPEFNYNGLGFRVVKPLN